MINFNIDNYLRISLTDVVLVLISTCLIIIIAKHFFWDKLVAFMQKRQAIIQENIDASNQLKMEALNQKEVYDAKLKDVGKEAHSILESAKARAEEEKDEIIQNAQIRRNILSEKHRKKLKEINEMRKKKCEKQLVM